MMKTTRKVNGLPRHLIHSLPYEERLRGYEREKDELFYKIVSLPAEEVQRLHHELIKKWGI